VKIQIEPVNQSTEVDVHRPPTAIRARKTICFVTLDIGVHSVMVKGCQFANF
jgi:hypothetical protein